MTIRTYIPNAPGSDYMIFRGKKLLATSTTQNRVVVGVWKERPGKGDAIVEGRDGQQMSLTPEEALDLSFALCLLAWDLDPDAEAKYRAWVDRRRALAQKGDRGDTARAMRGLPMKSAARVEKGLSAFSEEDEKLIRTLGERYRGASKRERSRLVDEFVAASRFDRTTAYRMLRTYARRTYAA
jgi:hypothetical protein